MFSPGFRWADEKRLKRLPIVDPIFVPFCREMQWLLFSLFERMAQDGRIIRPESAC